MVELRNRRVVVMGLGRFGGGIAVSRWLAGEGARVLVTDQEGEAKLKGSVEQLKGLPIEFRLGEHREGDFRAADVVVASPAVPPNNPYLAAARAAGVPITTEMRLFVERCPAKRALGVTGTKGKSTTTAMLHAIVSAAKGRRAWLGGNIGRSLLADLPDIAADDLVVLELSSYMLEHLRPLNWSPHVAVVTMVARDHLEWHGSEGAYVSAKKGIVEHQGPGDFAVLNAACPRCTEFARATRARVRFFDGGERRPFELHLVGAHNQVNAQAAFAAAECVGVTWEQAQAALAGFEALDHRLQFVHEENGVRYYNDSIATIPEAAIAALESFPPKKVIQIVGGRLKGHSLVEMSHALVERAKAVLGIGETGPEILALLARSTATARPQAYDCQDLATAVARAKAIAHAGDIVLLSPGCKSYDQFDNFERRGEEFVRLVKAGC